MITAEDAEGFASFFRGRTDARGKVDGGCIRETVTINHYQRHLQGKESLGIYLLINGNLVVFSAVDIDVQDFSAPKHIRDALTSLNITSYIALSKSSRFHLYTFYLEPVPAVKVRELYRRVLSKLDVEHEIFPKQDTLPPGGLGNYINLPLFGSARPFLGLDKQGNPRPLSLSYVLDNVKVVSEEHLNRALEELPPVSKEQVNPSWVAKMLGSPIRFGQRDDSITKVAGYFHRKGVPKDITLAILKSVAIEKGEHTFTAQDIAKCVGSVYKYPDRGQRTLELVPLVTLLNKEGGNPGYLVSDILPEGGVSILGGEPGSGKTWVVLALARDVAGGQPFLGRFTTEQGPVLIIDEESGENRLRKRMKRLGAADSLPISFSIMKVINLSDPSWEEPLCQAIDSIKPKLVIMDSLVRVHRGDENDATQMAKLFSALTKLREEFGCAFLITHHFRKRQQQAKMNTLEQRLRGSSDIAAYADTVLGIDRVDERLVLTQLKNRDGEMFKPLALAIDDVADDRTEIIVLEEVDAEADKRKQARDLIRKALKDKTMLREDLVSLAKGEGISDRTLADAVKSLVDAGELTKETEGHKVKYLLKK